MKIKIAVFYCITILLLALATECLVRIASNKIDLLEVTGKRQIDIKRNDWRVNDAFCAYRGTPNYKYKSMLLNKTVNKDGFISTPDISLQKPKNTVRIVFLGGSATAGTGTNLSDEITWPWMATEIVKNALPNKNIEFINASLSGYSSFESYGRLWARVRFFSPDIIVVYHGWNEMYYFNKEKIDNIVNWRTNQPNGGWDVRKEFSAEIIKPFFLDHIFRYSQTISYVRYMLSKKNFEAMPENIGPLSEDFDERGLDIWRDNLKLIKNAAELMDAKLFVCKQATLIVDNLPEKELQRCRFDFHGFDYLAHLKAFRAIYEVIDEEFSPEDVIDVTTISGETEYFRDHIHPTKTGAEAIARIVARKISGFLVNNTE